MANHPNRVRKYRVTTIAEDMSTMVVGDNLTRSEAFRAAKKAAGKGARYTGVYGPDAWAYRGAQTAVISA